MVAPVAPESVTEKVSFGSATVSPMTLTATVLLVSPGLNVSVPPVLWKSLPAVAVPPDVAQLTVTGWALAADSDTAKTAGVVPALPSGTDTSLTLKDGSGGPCGGAKVTKTVLLVAVSM
jgi:hypothetical protein